jgi:hypothetical protein
MLDADELPSALTASAAFRDVPQFWDGGKLLGNELARALGAGGWTAWDIYLFYPPGVEWTDAGIPVPEAALAQAGGVLVGSKGTLPPLADQSHLPNKLRGYAEVVGEHEDFGELRDALARVAAAFAARYPDAAHKNEP